MRLLKSFGFALQGIRYCFAKEPNFFIHVIFAGLAFTAGLLLGIQKTDWLVIIIAMVIVMAAEMFNTAIEILCNRITRQPDAQIKMIKDIAAGAVLISAMGAAIAGIIVFLPYIIALAR